MWHLDDETGYVGIASDVHVCESDQNSEQWDYDRIGIPTASAFHKVLAGGQGKTRRKYMMQLLGERLTGEPAPGFSSAVTDRGHEMEPNAAADYVIVTGNEVETIGFMRCNGMGASVDRIVTGQPGFVEIKSKQPDILLEVILADEMPNEHKPQVQGGLMVSGLEWADFVAYWPGLPLFVKRIYRDEKYIDWLRSHIRKFNQELDELEKQMRQQYYEVA